MNPLRPQSTQELKALTKHLCRKETDEAGDEKMLRPPFRKKAQWRFHASVVCLEFKDHAHPNHVLICEVTFSSIVIVRSSPDSISISVEMHIV